MNNDELVQAIIINKKGWHDGNVELTRMATKLNTQVIGGFSKLMKHVSDYIDFETITSYVYKAWFNGEGYKEALKDIFRPEFLNRLDEILEFDSLNEKQIAEIVNLQLKDFAKRLAEQDFKLVVDDKALAQLAKDGYDPAFGARPVKRAIQRELENPIAKNIIAGKYLPGAEIKVTAKDGAIVV